jgi:mRNA-degrading endonuclease RelE of RelBE toxin-antitoxin system
MPNAIEKFLAKINAKEKKLIQALLLHITKRNFTGLDHKKLTGSKNIFRVRKGDFRIIYKIEGRQTIVIAIQRRNESTYRDF